MKIALLATTSWPTPPPAYGGEIFWWDLCCAFAQLGHDVTLYAAPGSLCPPNGRLRYLPGLYGTAVGRTAEAAVVRWYTEEILQADYIIDASHQKEMMQEIAYFHPEAKGRTIGILNGLVTHTPFCPPYHLVVGSEKWKELSLSGLSQFHGTPWEEEFGAYLRPLPPESIIAVIPWAVNTEFYKPSDHERENYYLWFSRPTPYKGLHRAITLAEETGITLRLAMPMELEEHKFFGEKYFVMIEEARERKAHIEIVKLPGGSHHHEAKRELYRRAKALLFTIEAHEPWGLVVAECLACGTPVIASRMGAMPELLQHGKTGYLAYDDEGFKNAIKWIEQGRINPAQCRTDAVERFDRMRAARDYLALYGQ